MLISSTGLSIDMHFCGDNLKSFNLFGKAKNCFELAEMQAHCTKHNMEGKTAQPDCEMQKKDCCSDRNLSLKSDITADLVDGTFLLSPELSSFVIAFATVFGQKIVVDLPKIDYKNYKPPLILRDIPVLIQSFLL